MITIAFEGMHFHAYVGWYEEEKVLGNEIVVDIYLNVPLNHPEKDQLSETVNYETVFAMVKQILTGKMNLLETACQKIIAGVATLSHKIEGIQVRVSKMNPPIPGRVDRVFVEQEWIRE